MDGEAGSHGNTQLVTRHKKGDGDDDFKIKGAATPTIIRSDARTRDLMPDTCTICLQAVNERAVAVPCNHLSFDFLCLASWLQEQATCPLCKAVVTEVQYDFGGPADYKTYRVSARSLEKEGTEIGRGMRGRGAGQRARLRTRRGGTIQTADPAVERRRRVYRDRTYSKHVGANSHSRHRDFTPTTFAHSEDLQSRARAFLRRELQVFLFLDRESAQRGGGRHYLVEYIVAVLKAHELKGASGQAEELVAEFLGEENARLLLHELEAWLRSPCARLEEWDGMVQYPAGEVMGKA